MPRKTEPHTYSRPDTPVRWMVFDHPITGKRVRKSTGKTSKAEAERFMHATITELEKAQDGSGAVLAAWTLHDAWSRHSTLPTLALKTREQYRYFADRACGLKEQEAGVRYLNPTMQLKDLRTHHIDWLIDDLLRAGASKNTCGGIVRSIRSMVTYARKQKWQYPSLEQFDPTPLKGRKKERVVSLEKEPEIIAWLQAGSAAALSRGHRPGSAYDKAIYLYYGLVETGVRYSELVALAWDQFDLATGTAMVPRGKTATLAPVPVSDLLLVLLKQRLNQPRPFMMMDRACDRLQQALDAVCNVDLPEKAERVTLHNLRHSLVTRLAEEGMSLTAIGKVVGHASDYMTRAYEHLEALAVLDPARDAINRVGAKRSKLRVVE